jgi:2-polyprenyl-3-methyl-5-hydroxy-6-metoxy-1,4-benzoquinol methylase|tara:strand:+ start:1842 stop:2669 length:828 start_codon:yes stop_codon:yes gene_type:complete
MKMTCILCNGILDEYSKESNLDLSINHCKNCNLYISGNTKQEVIEKVSELYKGDYWNEHNSETSINSEYTDTDSQGKRRNWVSQFLYTKQYITGKTLLEIGVGAGQSILWFEEEGFDVSGIEPDGRNVSMINKVLKRGKVAETSVEEFSSDKVFDVIWMSHVLEHLIEPVRFLKKIRNNLKKNGIFFIEVPNCEYEPMLQSSIEKNPHLYHFTKKALTKMVEQTEYRIMSCDIFRPATKSEGMRHKILKNSFPYYPRIMTDVHSGRDLRIILKNS